MLTISIIIIIPHAVVIFFPAGLKKGVNLSKEVLHNSIREKYYNDSIFATIMLLRLNNSCYAFSIILAIILFCWPDLSPKYINKHHAQC